MRLRARAPSIALLASIAAAGGCSSIERVTDDLGVKRLGEKVSQAFAPTPGQPAAPSRRSPLVAVAGDSRCDRLVEPFELIDNLIVLARVSADQGVPSSRGSRSPRSLAETKAAAKHMNWMPLTVEKLYGERLHGERKDVIRATSKQGPTLYKQGNEILARIVAQIPEPRPVEFQLFVTEPDDGNAEAYPGGYLYVSRGALKRGTEYAAFALAHEIAHVTKRHTTKELQANLVDSATTFDQLKTVMSVRGATPSTVVRWGQALHGHFLKYSQDQEAEADACAVRLLAGISGIDARKAAEAFLKELGEDSDGSRVAKGRVSTHPSYQERKGRIQRVLAHYARGPSR